MAIPLSVTDTPTAIQTMRGLIENRLSSLVPSETTWPARLHEAQRHALLSPGKRFRPLLCVFIAQGGGIRAGAELDAAISTGCVAEMVHAASLILDDLPCMDDADLRRNQPTTHIAFDESTAILSATALLNCAFGVLSRLDQVPAQRRIEMIDLLSYAVGSKGLIAGQMADLANVDQGATIAEIERLNTLKTGALFDFSVEAAAILAGMRASQRAALKDFSYHLGLAFQLLDDVKDVVMSDAEAEKSVNRDIGKATILALAGSEASKRKLQDYLDHASAALQRAELSNLDMLTAIMDHQFAFLRT
ncbi:(2E,6E)-farnesyl diphosphate synthase [Litorimonas cladophorae]|uniref:(2E,6E)-farnesyl diphosphate synthase n=1 Tax=Litorimonas cladophorae TaxID=1220491 RepID=A0A918ND72_9PROT|nr:polyprenyl synthetase family protein [Litorimonas cladophorae]GGX59347.1 (2E,6E)-farnesyl diphosphate synthase [Litorimonas cladophorae]